MSETEQPILDWVMADCPSCGKTMKVRADMVGRRQFACPVCKSQLNIEFAGDEREDEEEAEEVESATEGTEEVGTEPSVAANAEATTVPQPWKMMEPRSYRKRAEVPFETNPVSDMLPTAMPGAIPVTGRMPHMNRVADGGDEEGREMGDEEFRERLRTTYEARPEDGIIRVRKRKRDDKSGGLLDWNEHADAEIPEAEMRGDEWTSALTQMPEEAARGTARDVITRVEIIAGQEVRHVKRIHKRSVVTVWRLFFKRMTKTLRWSIIALVAAIFGGGIYFVVRALGTRPALARDEVVTPAKEKELRIMLTQTEMNDAVEALQGYLGAGNLADKLKWIRDPERVRPLMESWYKSHPVGAREFVETLDVRKEFISNGYYILLAVRLGAGFDTYTRYYAIEQIKKGEEDYVYKVDWEMAEQYQPMDIEEFEEKMSDAPVDFRLLVKPYDYPNHEYADREKWACYRLEYPGKPEVELYGYVEREATLYNELNEALALEANLIVRIHYPKGAISSKQVLIDKIVHKSMFYEWPAGAAQALKAAPNAKPVE